MKSFVLISNTNFAEVLIHFTPITHYKTWKKSLFYYFMSKMRHGYNICIKKYNSRIVYNFHLPSGLNSELDPGLVGWKLLPTYIRNDATK